MDVGSVSRKTFLGPIWNDGPTLFRLLIQKYENRKVDGIRIGQRSDSNSQDKSRERFCVTSIQALSGVVNFTTTRYHGLWIFFFLVFLFFFYEPDVLCHLTIWKRIKKGSHSSCRPVTRSYHFISISFGHCMYNKCTQKVLRSMLALSMIYYVWNGRWRSSIFACFSFIPEIFFESSSSERDQSWNIRLRKRPILKFLKGDKCLGTYFRNCNFAQWAMKFKIIRIIFHVHVSEIRPIIISNNYAFSSYSCI